MARSSIDVGDLARRLGVVERELASVVAELRTRKVIPPVPKTAKKGRRVKMSPEARRQQRAELAAEARKHRWSEDTKKS